MFLFLFVFYLRQVKNSKWFASDHVGWPKAASQGPGCPLNVASPDFDPRERLGVFLEFFFLFYIREFVALLWSPRITLQILTLKKQESEGLSLCMLYTRKYISQHLEPLGRNHSSSLNKTCLIRCT